MTFVPCPHDQTRDDQADDGAEEEFHARKPCVCDCTKSAQDEMCDGGNCANRQNTRDDQTLIKRPHDIGGAFGQFHKISANNRGHDTGRRDGHWIKRKLTNCAI